MQATPATWRLLIEPPAGRAIRALTAHCGGEAMPRDLAAELLPLRRRAVEHGYGPTETTVWSSFHRVERADGAIPIGAPIANTQLHVLDERGQLVPRRRRWVSSTSAVTASPGATSTGRS